MTSLADKKSVSPELLERLAKARAIAAEKRAAAKKEAETIKPAAPVPVARAELPAAAAPVQPATPPVAAAGKGKGTKQAPPVSDDSSDSSDSSDSDVEAPVLPRSKAPKAPKVTTIHADLDQFRDRYKAKYQAKYAARYDMQVKAAAATSQAPEKKEAPVPDEPRMHAYGAARAHLRDTLDKHVYSAAMKSLFGGDAHI